MAITLGAALVKSAKPEERQEGIRLLEGVAHGRGNAIGILAEAVRAEDPVRARKLLEEAIRLWPGYSGYLADMLLKGEGGPKNERRAVSLVGGGWWGRASDAPSVRAMYGRLLVEGRLVTRDVKKGIELIFQGSNDYDTRLELIRALVANPEVPLSYPDGFLYDATVAAELGEPGAMAALIDLKLSRHVQFADKAGRLRAARTSYEEWRSARCQPRCRVREVTLALAALRLVALVTAKAHHLARQLHGSAVWNPNRPRPCWERENRYGAASLSTFP